MDPTVIGLLVLLAVLVCLALRVPIGVALGLPSIIGISLIVGTLEAGPRQGVSTVFTVFSRADLVVLPLYIAIGTLAFSTGLARDVFEVMERWFGRARGGLAIATGLGAGVFAAVTGSSLATVATMARTALPEMLRYGYAPRLAAATIAASGSVGILIPPSIILVVYGILAEQSIGRLLLGGIVPGVLTIVANAAAVLIVAWRHPDWAPRAKRYGLRERLRSTTTLWPVIIVFVLVVGGIYSGVWRPAESAAAGGAAVIVIALLRDSKNRGPVWNGLVEAAALSVSIMFMVAGAFVLARLLALSGLSRRALEYVSTLDVPTWTVIAMFCAVFFLLGMFLEGTTILAMTVPIVVPAVLTLGLNPIWFGIIMVKMIEIAMITPPVGLNVYTLSAMQRTIGAGTIFRGVVPFILADVVVVALLFVFPSLVTALPNAAFG